MARPAVALSRLFIPGNQNVFVYSVSVVCVQMIDY